MVRCNFASLLANFRTDERGNFALMMGLLAVPLVGAVGYGLDYARAVNYKSSLNSAASAATLAALDTARAMILADVNATTSSITAAASARALKVFNVQAPDNSAISFSPPTIVTTRVGNTLNASVAYSATIQTTLAQIVGVSTIQVSGNNESIGNLTDGTGSNPDLLVDENFDKFTGTINPWGMRVDFNNWKTTGLGVEIGKSSHATYNAPPPPNGATYMAELDAYTNTSISKKVSLSSGNYQLRYYYFGRVPYSTYDPAWLCGTKTEDVDWASNLSDQVNGSVWGYQSNRIGVYLHPALNEVSPAVYAPALHNMLDICVVTGGKWIERNIDININTPGNYWLAFQAEGVEDGSGGLLTGIRLCKNTCAGTPQENFPWTANQLLFSDSFETPDGTVNWHSATLDASGTNDGWPRLPSGWTTSPENQVDFQPWARKSGISGIELDAGSFIGTPNRAISRKFILAPGYYSVSYYYISARTSAPLALCGASSIASHTSLVQSYNATNPTYYFRPADSMRLGVYMDPDLSYAHPESEPILRAIATWTNPDGSAETLPRLPANMIDACVASPAPTQRTVNLKVTKPGHYWLTFRAEGAGDAWGAAIDDLTFTALGGLSMPNAPSGALTVKAPGLAFGSPIMLNGLQITAQ